MQKRVVITGMGVVSPIGNDIKTFSHALRSGKCGIDFLDLPESQQTLGIRVKVAAQVKDFQPEQYGITTQQIRRSDRFTLFALAAAEQAMQQSALRLGVDILPEQLGVYIGSGIGGLDTFVQQATVLNEQGAKMVSPLLIPMLIANIAGANVAIRYGAQGPCLTTTSACTSGTNAIGEAFYAIQRGDAQAIIAGGSEAVINPMAIGGFQNARALTLADDPLQACLPFDRRRAGFVMAEGAGILILEELEHARARGAHIIAEVCGYGHTCDAYHLTAPAPDGIPASRAMQRALNQAGYQNHELLYINAHGTGTRLNDLSETNAIKLAIGQDNARHAMISSTKSMTGHMIGAAGAVEAIVCALSLSEGFVPPTIGLTEPDPECDLDYVPLTARYVTPDIALSNSLGFGGHNAALVLRKY